MTKPVHAYFDSHERWHGKGYGCVWKHATHNYIQSTKKYVKVKGDIEECDYQKKRRQNYTM